MIEAGTPTTPTKKANTVEVVHTVDFVRNKVILLRGQEVIPSWNSWASPPSNSASTARASSAQKLHISSLDRTTAKILAQVTAQDVNRAKKNPQHCFLLIEEGGDAFQMNGATAEELTFWFVKIAGVINAIQVAS